MPASITFRLRSSQFVGTIDVNGSVISYEDVREAIAAKLSAPPEEIHVFLAGSNGLLHLQDDIPAYAVVEVERQMATGRVAPRRPPPSSTLAPPPGGRGGPAGGDTPTDGGPPLTEEERLVQLQSRVAMETGISDSRSFRRGGYGGEGEGGRGRGRGGGEGGRGRGGGGMDMRMPNFLETFTAPPKGYICHNCGKGGHLIQHCPEAKGGKAMKVLALPVGIPESMLEECTMDDPAPKFITRDRRLVKRKLETAQFTSFALAPPTPAPAQADGAPTSSSAVSGGGNKTDDARLQCVVDHVMAKEALKLPCCQSLICAACFDRLLERAMEAQDDGGVDGDDEEDMDEGGSLRCPKCQKPLLVDDVKPALVERDIIRDAQTRKRPRQG